MARRIEADHHATLDDYGTVAHLGGRVRELRDEAARLVPRIGGRRVWMLNSTAQGGGVAELLPPLVALLRELGVDAGWLVMEPREAEFFPFTKRLHNLVHGRGEAEIGAGDRALYERVSRETADRVAEHLAPGDVLVVHDPQPMGAGALLRARMDVAAVWRCHIGLDSETPETRAAWDFLCGFAEPYDRAVFTAPEYVPPCLAGRSAIIHPAIDPLSLKNRDLSVHDLVGILAAGSLLVPSGPVLAPPFDEPARRLQKDGGWAPATQPEDIGLLFRPIVTQVSRWDRLKGFVPLLRGFTAMKRGLEEGRGTEDGERRVLEAARLVLAGPDPASVQDDPEALEVLDEVRAAYLALPPHLQDAVAIVSLPMSSAEQNALMVNALQRCSDVVAQNSLQEGFGLTATEAMWKRTAVMGSRAAGLRQQIRPDVDGCMVDAEDTGEIARTLAALLTDRHRREALGGCAQQRVHHDFLVFTQVHRWLEVIADVVEARWG